MKSKVVCVIMGGGRGTRLHPLTSERCKPAVPLAGKYRLVDIPISNCLNSGLNQIFVLTQFNTASLHRHIQESYKFDPFGGGFVDILSAEQTQKGDTWYQGTADAVRQNLHHLDAEDDDLVLILSGDQLYQMDFDALIEQHRRTQASVTVAAKAMPTDEVHGLGLMRVQDDLSIREFVEKPTDPKVIEGLALSEAVTAHLDSEETGKRYVLANMGIYCFDMRSLRLGLDNAFTDFGKEVIPDLLGKVNLMSFVFEGYWEDIGTVHSFFEANLGLADPVPPFNFFDQHNFVYTRARYLPASKINSVRMKEGIIAGGCIVTDADLERVVIGVRSTIRSGTSFNNVVMMGADLFEDDEDREQNRDLQRPDIGVGKNCHIEKAIIDKNARIGDNVRLSPEGKPDMFEEGDVIVRDGVLIVVKNGVVPDHTVI
jgi:glucose-1-phosphate adenylyltransferase